MTSYVLDTSSIRVFANYYPSRFPGFWENLANYVAEGRIISVREVYNELDLQSYKPHVVEWTKTNRSIFLQPTEEEMAVVARLFQIPHFRQLVGDKQIARGSPVADPFVIASASERGACVVTQESNKANAGKIPNVCARFGVDCIDLEGFMEREDWSF